MNNYKKQKGAVLLIAMVFLIVITIIGVSAVSSSSIKTQVAGNNMLTMLVYQGAESTIARSVIDSDLKNLAEAMAVEPATFDVPAVYLQDESIGSGVLTSKSGITFIGGGQACPPSRTDMATSTVFNCQFFNIDARSSLTSSNARDRHLEGTAIVQP
jgi:type IV pilus assembly protein PilX